MDVVQGARWGPHLRFPVAGCLYSPFRVAGIQSSRHGLRHGLHHGLHRHGHYRGRLLVNFVGSDLIGGGCTVATTVVDIGQVAQWVVDSLSPQTVHAVAAVVWWYLPARYCLRGVVAPCCDLHIAP